MKPALLLATLASALLAPLASALAEPASEAPIDLPPGERDTTQTKCGVTVCATSIAVSSVVCTRPAYLTVQCTAAGTMGGQGTSVVHLPGRVDWSGSTSCSGDCGSPASGSRLGSATWSGVTGADGGGSQTTAGLGTKTRVSAFRVCISQTLTTNADATAKTTAPGGVTLESVTAPRATHRTTSSLCNY